MALRGPSRPGCGCRGLRVGRGRQPAGQVVLIHLGQHPAGSGLTVSPGTGQPWVLQ